MEATNIQPQKNIVFIGASSAAMGAAFVWCDKPHPDYRMILIEAKSHYNHVFAFPRASVKPGFEQELFVPYHNMFLGNDRLGKVIQAKATSIEDHQVILDRDVEGFGHQVEFDYLIYSAGAQIPAPGRFTAPDKESVIQGLKAYQELIKEATHPIIIGAGAVGLELAAEIKEYYPEKKVTLLHSRHRYLPRYKVSLDVMTFNILKKKGVRQVLGDRVILPQEGFPQKVEPIEIKTKGGRTIQGDLAIMCIGMTPNSELIKSLSPQSIDPQSGFINIKPTMQLDDDRFPHIYIAGDVSNHTDVKTGHYAWMQGVASITNVLNSINGRPLEPYKSKDLALIKLVLGKKDAVVQTHVLGPLVVLPPWVMGRNIPENVFANYSWSWLRLDIEEYKKLQLEN